MNIKTNQYLKHLSKLDYPEYLYKTRTAGALIRGYSKNKYRKSHVDLERLDLSLGQNDKISKVALKSLTKSLNNIGLYAFSQNDELLTLLSEANRIPKDKILITAGCDGALRILSRMFINRSSKVCIPTPSFSRFEYHTKVNMGKIHFIHSAQYPHHLDLKRVLEKCQKESLDFVFIANPNNPTGNFIDKKTVKIFLEKFKGITVLDESLILSTKQSCLPLLKNFPNLVITRSFSKIYGLAGLRIGYILASKEITDLAKKLASPFETSSVAVSMAIGVLKDGCFYTKSQEEIRKSINLLHNFEHPGIQITPTVTSTALIKSNRKRNLYYQLLKHGIKTVSCKDFRRLENDNCVRIAIKDTKSVKILLNILSGL